MLTRAEADSLNAELAKIIADFLLKKRAEVAEKDAAVAADLKKLQGLNDVEAAHGMADDLLCDLLKVLGYEKTVEAYNEVEKWYA